jgi:hypothetical protein
MMEATNREADNTRMNAVQNQDKRGVHSFTKEHETYDRAIDQLKVYARLRYTSFLLTACAPPGEVAVWTRVKRLCSTTGITQGFGIMWLIWSTLRDVTRLESLIARSRKDD